MESDTNLLVLKNHQASDAEVVMRVLNGEKELYELLMRRYNQKLYRVIRSYIKEENEAEDAMQDTYLLAYEKLYQFRNTAMFSTWLIRIGINVALGKLRERKQFALAPVTAESVNDDIWQLPASTFTTPESIAIQKEMKQLLERAIDTIPDKYRIIYILREVEGMSIHDITQCLDLSESNVKIRLHRAKVMLKESLYKLSVNADVFEFGLKRCDNLVERVMALLQWKE